MLPFIALVLAACISTIGCGGGAGDEASSGSGGAGPTGTATGPGTGTGTGAGAGVCPGTDPWPEGSTTCRTAEDCAGIGECVAQPIGGCGGCLGPPHDCAVDTDCGDMLVCEPVSGDCCGSPIEGAQCQARCPDVACPADATCGPTGHCEPTPCDGGYACPADRVCKPETTGADAHGCVLQSCSDGHACGEGTHCDPSSPGDPYGCAPTSCTAGYTCPEGTACSSAAPADPHGCAPIHCTEGFTCPVNTDCDPMLSGHGCADRPCDSDGDCDCGACVLGTCRARLWICDSPPS